MIDPVLARIFTRVVIVVPRVVVHVGPAVPPVGTVVVVVIDGRADRDTGGEPDDAGDGGIGAVVLLDNDCRGRRRGVDDCRVVLRHVDDLRVGRLDHDHLVPTRCGLGLDALLWRVLE